MYRIIMCAVAAFLIGNQAIAQTPAIRHPAGDKCLTLMVGHSRSDPPFGEHPIGYVQYSPGGHMVVFLSIGDLKPAAGATYTDAQRINLYNGIFAAYAGTYSVE